MRLTYIANLRIPTEKAYGVQITKMCEAFADGGIKTELLVPFRKGSIKENIFDYYGIKRNFKIKKLCSPDFYLPGKSDKIAFGIKSFISAAILFFSSIFSGFDVVYSRDELPLYFLSFFRKNIFFEAHKFSKSRGFFYRRFKNKDFKIIVISKGLENEFIKSGFKPENILVAPDGVDTDEFDISETKEECRKKSGLPQDKKIVLYAGHLFEWKGVHILAEAAARLPEVLFVFVGGTEADVLNFKERFGNEKNIKILGQKPHREIPSFLRAADALILPNSAKEAISVSYTSPLKLFEYMASRKPIIASDLPSIREVLNERNSILVKPDDAEALAGGIKKALEDVAFSDRISQTAFENAREYTWRKRAAKIIRFIQDL